MGHGSDGVYQKHYQSSLSNVDVQSLVLNSRKDDYWDISKIRRTVRHVAPPPTLSSKWTAKLDGDPRLQGLSASAYNNQYTILYRSYYDQFLQEWHASAPSATTSVAPSSSHYSYSFSSHSSAVQSNAPPKSVEWLGDLGSIRTRSSILMQLDPRRRRVMEASEGAYSLREDLSTLHSLISLSSEDEQAWLFYPGETPRICQIEGQPVETCPCCSTDLSM